MTDRPTLYSSPGSHHCRRVTLLIAEAGLDIETRIVDVRPPGMGGANEQAEFLALNPNGKVPVLVVDGEAITESNAIMAYLCDRFGLDELLPTNPLRRARVTGWQYWQAAHLSPTVDALMGENMMKPMLNQTPDAHRVEELMSEFRRWAGVLTQTVTSSRWLAGEHLTCADLSVAAALMYAAACEIPIREYDALAQWLARVQSRDSWQATQPPALPTE